MTLDALVTLTTELLLLGVFSGATVTAIRSRDPLARDVVLIFGAFVPIILVALAGRAFGSLPPIVTYGLVALLFVQPLLVLRLVARLRDLPRWLLPAASVLVIVSLVPLAAAGLGGPTVAIIGTLVVFILLEALAAIYLAAEARRRRGASRVRMLLAALSSGGFALGFLASGAR